MIIKIERIGYKYLNENSTIEYPGVLDIINSLIDWDNSTFPSSVKLGAAEEDVSIEEDRTVLGAEPKLVPGCVFNYMGQSIGIIDKDTISSEDSSTGPLGIARIFANYILLEHKIKNSLDQVEYPKDIFDRIERSIGSSREILNTPLFDLSECSEEIQDLSGIGDLVASRHVPTPVLHLLKELSPELQDTSKVLDVTALLPNIDIFKINYKITHFGKVFCDEDTFIDDTHFLMELMALLKWKNKTKD